MRIRDASLVYQETQTSDNSTKTIDLDIVDPVSAIALEFSATGGTTSNINNPLHRCVTKIEIVDGSDVLASLSCEELQAMHWYKTGKRPTMRIDENASAGNFMGADLLFGRYLYDQEYAIDFTRFKNPQLKISWNLAAINAIAVTAYATGTFKISATAKVMEDFSAPGKYLMDKTIETWTGGTSGDKRSELPIDYPYRMIMLQSYLTQKDVWECFSKIKLTCDTDKYIPLERYTKEWNEEMANLFGRVVGWKHAFASDDDTIWLPVNQEPQVQIIKVGNATLAGYDVLLNWCWSGECNVNVVNASQVVYTTDQVLWLLYEGHCIHATTPIPMGDMARPETWFDPTPYKKIEVVLTEAAASANRIAVEQVRTY